MPRFLYSALLYLLTPFILLRLFLRGRKAPAYRQRIAERFGFFAAPLSSQGGLWVHAVSVGETIAAAPLIEHFLRVHPQLPVMVTTMTPTGSERVTALFGDRVCHVYAPYDLPCAVNRFLAKVQPKVAVIMETEVWPNMVCQAAARGVDVILANGRMSARSAAGYLKLKGLSASAFAAFAHVVAQGDDDAKRFIALGASAERVLVSGSIKFDVTIAPLLREQAGVFKAAIGSRPVWIAASTHPGEDEIIIAAHDRLLRILPTALLILVPRHPERFDAVATLLADAKLSFQRRSGSSAIEAGSQVLLGDTMGELMMFYGGAEVAFVGGSLVDRGGHNMLEPAAWGLPLVTGTSDYNFAEISQLLCERGGLRKVTTVEQLAEQVGKWLGDSDLSQRQGAAALNVVEQNRGALDKLIAIVDGALMSD